ncbi:hypothetical protein MTO96_005108 [Rhipicephalus appendiculatus]
MAGAPGGPRNHRAPGPFAITADAGGLPLELLQSCDEDHSYCSPRGLISKDFTARNQRGSCTERQQEPRQQDSCGALIQHRRLAGEAAMRRRQPASRGVSVANTGGTTTSLGPRKPRVLPLIGTE